MYLIETRISNPQHMQISRHYAVKHLLININVNSSNFAYNSKHIITCPIPNFKFKKMNSFDGRVYPLEFLAPNFHCVFAFLNENVTPGLTFKHKYCQDAPLVYDRQFNFNLPESKEIKI